MLRAIMILLSIGAGIPRAHAAESGLWREDLPSALQAAKEKQTLILVDFYAPWCYSCYFMAQNVLNQPEFRSFRGKIEPVKIDVDSPEGLRLKQEWLVHFLPSYVILNSERQEVGRIVGEQARADFYSQLRQILAQHSTLGDLKAKFLAAKPVDAAKLAVQILGIHQARGETAEGVQFYKSLPPAVQSAVVSTQEGAKTLARFNLAQAAQANSPMTCLRASMDLLNFDLGCDLPTDGEHINACFKDATAGFARPVYQQEELQLRAILKHRIFGQEKNRCADFRSPISFAKDLYTLTGRKAEADKVLDQAIALLKKEVGDDLTKDRSKTDNLRVFLELAGRDKELEEYFLRLIAAYPREYVYYYRFGKFLLQHKRPKEALTQFENAEPMAYGANKLSVVEQKGRTLNELGRGAEAAKLVDAALSDHPDDFPEQTASLRRLRNEIGQ